jgi:hypothetical protein
MFSRRTLLYGFDNTDVTIPRESSMTYTPVQVLLSKPIDFVAWTMHFHAGHLLVNKHPLSLPLVLASMALVYRFDQEL